MLVGAGTADDAGVYRLSPELALVQTVDIITPVVDEPRAYGAIAAANSISDIYAMGATPLCALNVVCFPSDCLPLDVLAEILEGAAAVQEQAGIPTIGGHTIRDQEPKFGLCVTGTARPDRVWTNAGARAGDRLVLTKPLGVGVITTAAMSDKAPAEVLAAAIASMATLNRHAAEAAKGFPIHACTDVTGFGLLGHLREMVDGAGVSVRLHAARVPVLPGARELAEADLFPGGAYRNRESVEAVTAWPDGLTAAEALLLCDPQTSGGLLFSVSPDAADALVASLDSHGVSAWEIGEVAARGPEAIEVLR